jgi:hypothetical protein
MALSRKLLHIIGTTFIIWFFKIFGSSSVFTSSKFEKITIFQSYSTKKVRIRDFSLIGIEIYKNENISMIFLKNLNWLVKQKNKKSKLKCLYNVALNVSVNTFSLRESPHLFGLNVKRTVILFKFVRSLFLSQGIIVQNGKKKV